MSAEKGGSDMAGEKGVSGKTHTRQQLNDYANQHNPNNKAFHANQQNQENAKRASREKWHDIGILDGESFGWCND